MNLLICQSLTVPQVYKFLRMLIFAHFAYFGHIFVKGNTQTLIRQQKNLKDV